MDPAWDRVVGKGWVVAADNGKSNPGKWNLFAGDVTFALGDIGGTMMSRTHGLCLCIVFIAFLLTGCETTGPKATVGGLGGAAAGGLLGAALGGKAEGIAAGAILGGLLGSAVGDRLDAADRQHASQTAYRALETAPSGTSLPWRNPDSGHSGQVTPTRTYQTAQGTYCREYQQTVMVGGRSQQAYGTACRQPDGSWKVMN